VDNVVEEAEWLQQNWQPEHIAFFDDALLFQPDHHIKPILRQFEQRSFRFRLHTPNGLQPRFLDEEMAQLMKAAGLATIRLSFESADPTLQQNKVSNQELAAALSCLEQAGYPRSEIGVYVLMGLAEQTPQQVLATIDFVYGLGARVHLASFSPVPGTSETERAQQLGLWSADCDLLLANNSLYPLWRQKFGFALCEEIVNYARMKNSELQPAAQVSGSHTWTAPATCRPADEYHDLESRS